MPNVVVRTDVKYPPLSEDEVGEVLSEGSMFTVTMMNGPLRPVMLVEHRSSHTLYRLRDTLDCGRVSSTRTSSYLTVEGVDECLRLIGYLDEHSALLGGRLDAYLAWKELVLYFAANSLCRLQDVHGLLAEVDSRQR